MNSALASGERRMHAAGLLLPLVLTGVAFRRELAWLHWERQGSLQDISTGPEDRRAIQGFTVNNVELCVDVATMVANDTAVASSARLVCLPFDRPTPPNALFPNGGRLCDHLGLPYWTFLGLRDVLTDRCATVGTVTIAVEYVTLALGGVALIAVIGAHLWPRWRTHLDAVALGAAILTTASLAVINELWGYTGFDLARAQGLHLILAGIVVGFLNIKLLASTIRLTAVERFRKELLARPRHQ